MRRLSVIGMIACGPLLLAACNGDLPCSENEYPVKAVDGPETTCIYKGQNPPAGWTTFPPGQTPSPSPR